MKCKTCGIEIKDSIDIGAISFLYCGVNCFKIYLESMNEEDKEIILSQSNKPFIDDIVEGKIEYLREGEACVHIGCINHISHPCEICGRIGAVGSKWIYKSVLNDEKNRILRERREQGKYFSLTLELKRELDFPMNVGRQLDKLKEEDFCKYEIIKDFVLECRNNRKGEINGK